MQRINVHSKIQKSSARMEDVIGVVVFGVGIAGRVRLRDLKDKELADLTEGRWKLHGFVSRRQLTIEGVQQMTEEEALSRDDVNAFLVCTEPAAHEDIIRKGLNHGKHVLVEYPVATSVSVAEELYALAKEKGLVLHEENIGLLTTEFANIKEKLSKINTPMKKAEIKKTGNYNGWVEDFKKSGGPFVVSVSMIQSLYKLFGDDLKATGGSLEMSEKGFLATGKFSTNKCSKLSISIRRTKDRMKRDKMYQFEFEDGSVMIERPEALSPPPKKGAKPTSKKMGLFMKDFQFFLCEIQGLRDMEKDIQRSCHCLRVAEEVQRLMGISS